MRWFTSDTHFTHANIIKYCDRPFNSVAHMNAELAARWNGVVAPEDTVFHLGDVGMGWKAETADTVTRLNGTKILVPGNHDEISSVADAKRRARFIPEYEKAFDVLAPEQLIETIGGVPVRLCHYPSQGDSRDKDRHVALRPPADGLPLLHGHTHSAEKISGPLSFHVGVDAHNFTPVPEEEIVAWLDTL